MSTVPSAVLRVLCLAVVALAAPPHAVMAQSQSTRPPPAYSDMPPWPPVAPGDLFSYCVYENRTYSLGSGLCLGRTAYVCVPSPGPSTGNRAYWTSKDDPIFSRPACP